MSQQVEHVVIREGFVIGKLRNAGEVIKLHERQGKSLSNVMLKATWDKLPKDQQQKLADTHKSSVSESGSASAKSSKSKTPEGAA